LNLQIFNLLCHFITTLFIYWIIRLVIKKKPDSSLPAILGCAFYIFLAPDLWYFSNVYSVDIFWHYIWVIGIFYVMKILIDIEEGRVSQNSLYILGCINFFMIYAEFQGLLFALSVIIYSLTQLKKSKFYKRIIITLIVSSVLSLFLTLIQYSSVSDGIQKFLNLMLLKGKERSYSGDFHFSWIIKTYFDFYSYAWAALGLIFLALILQKKQRWRDLLTVKELTLLFFAVFPVITHHLLLLQWTAVHEFSTLKSSLFFVFGIAILFNKISRLQQRHKNVQGLTLMAMLLCLAGSINTYKTEIVRSPDPDRFYRLGQKIRENVSDNETVFAISKERIVPQIVYYAKRNIQEVQNIDGVRDWLQWFDNKKIALFYIDEELNIIKIDRLEKKQGQLLF